MAGRDWSLWLVVWLGMVTMAGGLAGAIVTMAGGLAGAIVTMAGGLVVAGQDARLLSTLAPRCTSYCSVSSLDQ